MSHRSDPLPPRLVPPRPSAALRRRVLASALSALNGARPPDVWDRLWASRPARLAWAATVAGLVIGHLVISGRTPRAPAAPVRTVAAIATSRSELDEVVEMPRLTVELPGWEVASARDGERIGRKESS